MRRLSGGSREDAADVGLEAQSEVGTRQRMTASSRREARSWSALRDVILPVPWFYSAGSDCGLDTAIEKSVLFPAAMFVVICYSSTGNKYSRIAFCLPHHLKLEVSLLLFQLMTCEWRSWMLLRASVCFLVCSFFFCLVMGLFEDGSSLLAWVSEWLCCAELLFWLIKDTSMTEKLTFVVEPSWDLEMILLAPLAWRQGAWLVAMERSWRQTLCCTLWSSLVLWAHGTPSLASCWVQDSPIHVLQISGVPCDGDAYSKFLWSVKGEMLGYGRYNGFLYWTLLSSFCVLMLSMTL